MAHSGIKALEAPLGRASARFSADLIRQLVRLGHTQTDIANMLKVTKSFISRVASGQRALTIEHLATLERALGKPTALLLLEGADEPANPDQARERQRIRQLLHRPASPAEDKPLTPAEQAETDKLSDEIDEQLGLLLQSCQRKPSVSKMRVINLLKREAGLSPSAARRVYEVQTKFARTQGMLLFGT